MRFALVIALALALVGRDAPPPITAALAVGGLHVADDLSQASIDVTSSSPVHAEGPGARYVTADRRIEVPLHFGPDGVQRVSVRLTAGAAAGTLTLEYYPRSYYESIGVDSAGAILLFTDLPWAADRGVWPPYASLLPPELSLASHRDDWAAERSRGEVPSLSGGFEQGVLAMYRRFDALNLVGVGQVCDGGLSGIDAFRQMRSGACYVWCTGYAAIMRGFLRSAGIPSRLVRLAPSVSYTTAGVLVESSESHDTVEYWDGREWAWIDPTFRVLRVTDPAGEALSPAEVLRNLADPSIRDGLRFVFEDGATGAWTSARYGGLPDALRAAFGRYFTLDKQPVVENGGLG